GGARPARVARRRARGARRCRVIRAVRGGGDPAARSWRRERRCRRTVKKRLRDGVRRRPFPAPCGLSAAVPVAAPTRASLSAQILRIGTEGGETMKAATTTTYERIMQLLSDGGWHREEELGRVSAYPRE